ncbi:MAG: hypothetical protein A6D92_08035 [Symbiobacterium thermophilum]|uniref:Uncharacterized protein n=1 Tax=Symbiobacterium thermophilum TaxID=2734 RepID=A0A1Y2T689_SYMTR|nr:MAG: hypothetical protein A6D92_08035 [Symbiobacterium thermophilum]
MYGRALNDIAATEAALGIAKDYLTPFNDWTQAQFLALITCLMCGTAGLPHVIVRFYTTPNVRETRFSVGWALFFIGLMYITIPAYAAFARWEVLHNVVGQPIDALPGWVEAWTKTGLLTINDANGNGLVEYAEFGLNSDLVVLAMPEIAGLPYVVAGLVAAGGLAAALSTADGLLMVVATAISHDIYFKLINRSASDRTRLTISRVMLVTVAADRRLHRQPAAQHHLRHRRLGLLPGGASFFPILVLGIFWKRINTAGAITGMIAGLVTTLGYIIWSYNTGQTIGGILPNAAGIFGMPLNFLLTIAVSLATSPPTQEVQNIVERLRYPKHVQDVAAPATGD